MAETLTMELVTPLGKYEGTGILEIVLPAESGSMGVLPGHDVMVVALGTGPLIVHYPDRQDHFFVTRGYIQIDADHVRILAEICETQDQIDENRANAAMLRAEKRLVEHKEDLDWHRAEAALKRAMSRVEVKGM